ncbi:hypothetical protein [Hyunsoonleella pacifica]|uniref:hypothetical protein n=1 Tax=Hyunsoonleella pacifica TaxID=1080224 RepID=UPI0013EF3F7E|nr:hypothetical protein [Hyunsoonleella pacifica]GGD20465.1 hypothetical protein GCM10011368_22990 [Hyunsoonleella pacifica]
MKKLFKVVCLGGLLAISATSCTKTDLEAENEELVPVQTVGADGKVLPPPEGD